MALNMNTPNINNINSINNNIANNNNNVSNNNNNNIRGNHHQQHQRTQPSSTTTITSLITKLQQSFSDAMSTQKTTVDRRNFEKTYKNMNKVSGEKRGFSFLFSFNKRRKCIFSSIKKKCQFLVNLVVANSNHFLFFNLLYSC